MIYCITWYAKLFNENFQSVRNSGFKIQYAPQRLLFALCSPPRPYPPCYGITHYFISARQIFWYTLFWYSTNLLEVSFFQNLFFWFRYSMGLFIYFQQLILIVESVGKRLIFQLLEKATQSTLNNFLVIRWTIFSDSKPLFYIECVCFAKRVARF